MDFNKEEFLQYLLKEVIEEAKAVGIPISSRILPQVKINRRAKGRFGGCGKERKGLINVFRIEISGSLLDEAENDDYSDDRVFKIRQILAHEILHTCRGCSNHGERWKSYAEKMNYMYGYNIKRLTTYEEMGMDVPDGEEDLRYVLECEKCGIHVSRRRSSRFVQYPHLYRCGCGGSFRRL